MSHDEQPDIDHSAPTLPFVATAEAEATDPEPDLSGTILDGRYRLLHPLGAGGMGIVYAAEHVTLGTRIAVKVLKREFAHGKHRRRFLREAKAAATIRHPNVVQIMDFGLADDVVYFVMELVEGRDVARLLEEEGPLSWSVVRRMALQVASALEMAHQHGIIHRDVKPSNCIVFDEPGKQWVKVLDFGIAKVDDGRATQALTGTDELFGTVAYMAPELVEGTPASAASDVYALGVMLFQMLTGQLPFRGSTPLKVLTLHMTEQPPPPSTIVRTIPAEVDALVLRCMAKRPDQRFAGMADLVLMLERIGAMGAVGSPPPAPVQRAEPASREPRRTSRARFVAVAAFVTLAGGASWSLQLQQQQQQIPPEDAVGGDGGRAEPFVGDVGSRSRAPDVASARDPSEAPSPTAHASPESEVTPEKADDAVHAASEAESDSVDEGEPASGLLVQGSTSRRRGASGGTRRSPSPDAEARMVKLVRRHCDDSTASKTNLAVKVPVGSDGTVLSVSVKGGSKDLAGCVRDILRKQRLEGSSNRVLDFEVEL